MSRTPLSNFPKKILQWHFPPIFPPNPPCGLPSCWLQRLPASLSNARAGTSSTNFRLEPKNPARLTGAQRIVPLGSWRGDRGPGFPASRPPRPHFSGIPGTSSKAPLGHPGPPPLPPPACKLVSGSSASGSYTARPGGLARPQDHPGVTAPRPAARLPATRFPQRSGSTPGPGPGAARTGPELGSRHLPGPFKFSHGGGRKCSGITGPPARTSCAREGATMEEHR